MLGHLFTFEGGEYAGKGLQIKLLTERLRAEGHKISDLPFYEPGATELADGIRFILKKGRIDTPFAEKYLQPVSEVFSRQKIDPHTEAYLYLAARAHLINSKTAPELRNGFIVFKDRSVDSCTVYQGHVRDPRLVDLIRLNNSQIYAMAGIKIAKTILLDVPVEEALKRRAKANNRILDENDAQSQAWFEKIRNAYLAEAEYCKTVSPQNPDYNRIVVINGVGSPQEVHERVYSSIEQILKK